VVKKMSDPNQAIIIILGIIIAASSHPVTVKSSLNFVSTPLASGEKTFLLKDPNILHCGFRGSRSSRALALCRAHSPATLGSYQPSKWQKTTSHVGGLHWPVLPQLYRRLTVCSALGPDNFDRAETSEEDENDERGNLQDDDDDNTDEDDADDEPETGYVDSEDPTVS
jgi:hypothetical protein